MKNDLNSKIFGQILIAIGIVTILHIVFLATFFIGISQDIPSIYFFGPVSDVCVSLIAFLHALTATIVLMSQGKKWFLLNIVGVILTWIGTFIVMLDTLADGDIISKSTAAILRIKYGFPTLLTTQEARFGFGLIGVWLLLLNFQAMRTKSWPMYLIRLGFSTGIITITGFADSFGWIGVGILSPVWCFLLGRYVLRMSAPPNERIPK
jgi:hypothetical protein